MRQFKADADFFRLFPVDLLLRQDQETCGIVPVMIDRSCQYLQAVQLSCCPAGNCRLMDTFSEEKT